MKIENTPPVNLEIEKILNGINFSEFNFELTDSGDIVKYKFTCYSKEN